MSGESELPVVGDGPEDEVEIEITEEELGGEIPEAAEPEAFPEAETAEAGEPEAGEEAKEDEPKRRRSPDKRIAELTRRAAEAERMESGTGQAEYQACMMEPDAQQQ